MKSFFFLILAIFLFSSCQKKSSTFLAPKTSDSEHHESLAKDDEMSNVDLESVTSEPFIDAETLTDEQKTETPLAENQDPNEDSNSEDPVDPKVEVQEPVPPKEEVLVTNPGDDTEKLLTEVSDYKIFDLSAGEHHFCALIEIKSKHNLYCWGTFVGLDPTNMNQFNQFSYASPQKIDISFLEGKTPQKLISGGHSTCLEVLDENKNPSQKLTYCFGEGPVKIGTDTIAFEWSKKPTLYPIHNLGSQKNACLEQNSEIICNFGKAISKEVFWAGNSEEKLNHFIYNPKDYEITGLEFSKKINEEALKITTTFHPNNLCYKTSENIECLEKFFTNDISSKIEFDSKQFASKDVLDFSFTKTSMQVIQNENKIFQRFYDQKTFELISELSYKKIFSTFENTCAITLDAKSIHCFGAMTPALGRGKNPQNGSIDALEFSAE